MLEEKAMVTCPGSENRDAQNRWGAEMNAPEVSKV